MLAKCSKRALQDSESHESGAGVGAVEEAETGDAAVPSAKRAKMGEGDTTASGSVQLTTAPVETESEESDAAPNKQESDDDDGVWRF